MQSAPDLKSVSASSGDIPVINDAFSPFTTQKSILFFSLNFQRFLLRCSIPEGLVTSPIAKIFNVISLSMLQTRSKYILSQKREFFNTFSDFITKIKKISHIGFARKTTVAAPNAPPLLPLEAFFADEPPVFYVCN